VAEVEHDGLGLVERAGVADDHVFRIASIADDGDGGGNCNDRRGTGADGRALAALGLVEPRRDMDRAVPRGVRQRVDGGLDRELRRFRGVAAVRVVARCGDILTKPILDFLHWN
jgi:hypothetical protein